VTSWLAFFKPSKGQNQSFRPLRNPRTFFCSDLSRFHRVLVCVVMAWTWPHACMLVCVLLAFSLALSASPFDESAKLLDGKDQFFVDNVEFPDHASALRRIAGLHQRVTKRSEDLIDAQKKYEETLTDDFIRSLVESRRHGDNYCPLSVTGPNTQDFYADPDHLTEYSGLWFVEEDHQILDNYWWQGFAITMLMLGRTITSAARLGIPLY
jgi:hypothetical protein